MWPHDPTAKWGRESCSDPHGLPPTGRAGPGRRYRDQPPWTSGSFERTRSVQIAAVWKERDVNYGVQDTRKNDSSGSRRYGTRVGRLPRGEQRKQKSPGTPEI